MGWQRTEAGLDGQQRDFYIRQLRDWKYSIAIEALIPKGMRIYGELCGWTLARAHARSGDRIAIHPADQARRASCAAIRGADRGQSRKGRAGSG